MFVTCILFRHLCIKNDWVNLPIKKLLFTTLGFSAVAGAVSSGMTILITRSIGHILIPKEPYEMYFQNPDWSYVANEFYWSSINATFVILAWVASYLAILLYDNKKEAELENLKLANAYKEAQLGALSQQLNPHFLFNTLNNIRALVRDNKPEAVEMITAISEILKGLFSNKNTDKITIKDEIEIVDYLVDIVTIQHGRRLNYRQLIDEALFEALVPALSIQLLLENAIKHGLEELKCGCEITLRITSDDEKLFIQLSNTGSLQPVSKNSTSVGLTNLNKRLSLLYPNNASFCLRQKEGYVVAELRLPLEYL